MEATKKETMDAILLIVKRAQSMGIARGSQFTQVMDMEAADKQFNLRLDELAKADDFNFAHDFRQIQEHMNRETGRIEGFFVPRFASKN